MRIVRHFFVFIHRWAGLLMAAFLIVVGLTGSLLAFKSELERLVCPRILCDSKTRCDAARPRHARGGAEAQVPQGQVVTVSLSEPDQALLVFQPRKDPATGKPYELDFDQFFVDPWSGKELGRRRPGDLSQGLINLDAFHLSTALCARARRIRDVVSGHCRAGLDHRLLCRVLSHSARFERKLSGGAGSPPGSSNGRPARFGSISISIAPGGSGSGRCFWFLPGRA